MNAKTTIDRNTEFLEGPNSRGREFLFIIKVVWQFFNGFRKLHFIGTCITVFGSARFSSDHPQYQKAQKNRQKNCPIGVYYHDRKWARYNGSC